MSANRQPPSCCRNASSKFRPIIEERDGYSRAARASANRAAFGHASPPQGHKPRTWWLCGSCRTCSAVIASWHGRHSKVCISGNPLIGGTIRERCIGAPQLGQIASCSVCMLSMLVPFHRADYQVELVSVQLTHLVKVVRNGARPKFDTLRRISSRRCCCEA